MAYVLDSDNRIQVRSVEVGIEGSQLAEIKSGLQPGDRVILGGQGKYQQNEQVTPVVEKTPASETAPQTGGMIDMSGEENSENGGA